MAGSTRRRDLRLAPTADAFFDAPLFLTPGHVLEQIRQATQHLGEDPLASQVMLAARARHRLQLGAEPTGPGAFQFVFSGPSSSAPEDGVAIIRVVGSLYRGMFWDDYAEIRARVDAAMEDPAVRAVLLDIDSPGGRVAGLFDLTRHLHELSAAPDAKPVWAIANEQATSAAYAIGSACKRFIVTPSGIVGSIGCIILHADQSRYDRERGLTVTEVASGAHKTDLSPHKPLSDEGRSTLQLIVDQAAEQFFGEVASYRGIKPAALRAQEAALYVGSGARAAGLVDDVANFDEVLEQLRGEVDDERPSAPGGLPMFPSASAAEAAPGGPDMSVPDASQTIATPPAAAAPAVPAASPAPIAPAVAATQPAPAASASTPEADFQARARLISNACILAGRPELAGDMLARGLSVEAAQSRLLELRASTDGAVVNGQVSVSSTPQPKIDPAKVYQRWNDPAALARPAGAR